MAKAPGRGTPQQGANVAFPRAHGYASGHRVGLRGLRPSASTPELQALEQRFSVSAEIATLPKYDPLFDVHLQHMWRNPRTKKHLGSAGFFDDYGNLVDPSFYHRKFFAVEREIAKEEAVERARRRDALQKLEERQIQRRRDRAWQEHLDHVHEVRDFERNVRLAKLACAKSSAKQLPPLGQRPGTYQNGPSEADNISRVSSARSAASSVLVAFSTWACPRCDRYNLLASERCERCGEEQPPACETWRCPVCTTKNCTTACVVCGHDASGRSSTGGSAHGHRVADSQLSPIQSQRSTSTGRIAEDHVSQSRASACNEAGFECDDSIDPCVSSVGQGSRPATDGNAAQRTKTASADSNVLVATASKPDRQIPSFQDEGLCGAAGDSAQTNAASATTAGASPSETYDGSASHEEAVDAASAVHGEAAGWAVHEGKDELDSVDAAADAARSAAQMPDSSVPGETSGETSAPVTTAVDVAPLVRPEHEMEEQACKAGTPMESAGEGTDA